MTGQHFPYRVFALGDSAITLHFGNRVDEAINREVIARFRQLQNDPLPAVIEMVPAYSSLTIYYDVLALRQQVPPGQSVMSWMIAQLEEKMALPVTDENDLGRSLRIPVCYDPVFAPDLAQLASAKGLPVEEVIHIHCAKSYKVYMLGFLPGFAYMGEVDERIVAPRKPQPAAISAGSVGIAGWQTGIYPLDSPGGWQIIGRSPVKFFDAEKNEPALLRAGDRVEFYPIGRDNFNEMVNDPGLQIINQ